MTWGEKPYKPPWHEWEVSGVFYCMTVHLREYHYTLAVGSLWAADYLAWIKERMRIKYWGLTLQGNWMAVISSLRSCTSLLNHHPRQWHSAPGWSGVGLCNWHLYNPIAGRKDCVNSKGCHSPCYRSMSHKMNYRFKVEKLHYVALKASKLFSSGKNMTEPISFHWGQSGGICEQWRLTFPHQKTAPKCFSLLLTGGPWHVVAH